jgi:uncharacterized protein YdgA (DUF945 family)
MAILLGKNRQLGEELERSKATMSGLQYEKGILQRQAADWKAKTRVFVEQMRKDLDAQEADLRQKAHEQEARFYMKTSQLGQGVDRLQKVKKVLEEESKRLVNGNEKLRTEKAEVKQRHIEELAIKQAELDDEKQAHSMCQKRLAGAEMYNCELTADLATEKSANDTLRTNADEAAVARDKALAEVQQATESFEARRRSRVWTG